MEERKTPFLQLVLEDFMFLPLFGGHHLRGLLSHLGTDGACVALAYTC
jgi:hypothetical protein